MAGTEPKKNDSDFYTSCGINLRAPFADWQLYYNQWAANAGAHTYGRFSWSICGFAPKASPSGSPSGGPSQQPPQPTTAPKPTVTPAPPPTKKP